MQEVGRYAPIGDPSKKRRGIPAYLSCSIVLLAVLMTAQVGLNIGTLVIASNEMGNIQRFVQRSTRGIPEDGYKAMSEAVFETVLNMGRISNMTVDAAEHMNKDDAEYLFTKLNASLDKIGEVIALLDTEFMRDIKTNVRHAAQFSPEYIQTVINSTLVDAGEVAETLKEARKDGLVGAAAEAVESLKRILEEILGHKKVHLELGI